MKYCKFLLYIGFTIVMIFSIGCMPAEYESRYSSNNSFDVDRISIVAEDSFLLGFIKKQNWFDSIGIENYKPFSDTLNKINDASAAKKIYPRIEPVGNSVQPMTFEINFMYTYWNHINSLFLDFYGCDTYDCSNVDKIVLRSSDYSYSEVFDVDDFSITQSKKKFSRSAEGEDCEYTDNHLFYFTIKTKNVDVEMNVQIGSAECRICYEFCG